MALHTAGDLLRWHPHIHSLALHGALDTNGNFHPIDDVDTEYLTRLFADNVFDALLAEELIDHEIVSSMKNWNHSGFHVFVGNPIDATDDDARLFVARYLKKSAVALSRLEVIENNGESLIRINKTSDDSVQTRDLAPLQFLAELSQHIPDMWEQTTRYTGLYSARSRGAKRLALDTVGPLPEHDPPVKPSAYWAQCMKKIFEFDPLACPKCRGAMHIKTFIHSQNDITRICKNLVRQAHHRSAYYHRELRRRSVVPS